MLRKSFHSITCATALAIGLTMTAGQVFAQEKAAAPAAPQAKPTMAKICSNCHQPEVASLRGSFDSVCIQDPVHTDQDR